MAIKTRQNNLGNMYRIMQGEKTQILSLVEFSVYKAGKKRKDYKVES